LEFISIILTNVQLLNKIL